MKRYLITNPLRFTGQAEIIYNALGVLCKIDCSETNMGAALISAFKTQVPAIEADLSTFGSEHTQILPADIIISFEMFWLKYDRKINKVRAVKLFEKLSKSEQAEAYLGITGYDKYLKKTEWRSKADPDTYLRNRYWENEYK